MIRLPSLRIPLIAGLLVAAVTSGAAQDNGAPIQPISSGDLDWTIGVGLFEAPEDDLAARSAAALFPRILHDDLGGLTTHRLSSEDRVVMAREAVDGEIRESLRRMAGYHESRDALLFGIDSDPDALSDLDAKIASEYQTLLAWRTRSVDTILVPDQIPISFPTATGGGALWEADVVPPRILRESAGLDLLIAGEVTRVGEYYGVQVVAYTADGEIALWEGAGTESDLPAMADEAAGKARTLALGREWAGLEVIATPARAIIRMNGAIVGVGSFSGLDIRPGVTVVEVSYPGYATWVGNYVINPSFVRRIRVELEPADRQYALIRSEPTGAEIRLGSLYIGLAPQSVEIPDRILPLTLDLEGYQTRTVPIGPDDGRITVPLVPLVEDAEAILQKKRKRLYGSMTLFAISVAPPLVFAGISANFIGQFNANSAAYSQTGDPAYYDAAVEARQNYNITYGIMWGTIAVAAGFLTNVIFKLADFLKAAEATVP